MSRYCSRRREWSVNENSVKRTGSTGCRSLGWYYALTPVKPVTISNDQSVFAADVWRRSTNAYDSTRNGLCRPFQCVIGRFHRRTIIRPSVITMELLGLQSLRMSRDNLCSNLQCVEDFSTRVRISHV